MGEISVVGDLERWGPASAAAPELTLEEAEAYCRNLATSHYENFPVITWLLPRNLQQHFCNVYAYCRWADDLGDETGDSQRALHLLSWWREELKACYAGKVKHPVFVALQGTIEKFGIPEKPFDDLISAFEQDQVLKEYETFSQLVDYCTRSADPVGRIVLYLCECFTEERAVLSDRICTGLQLANFWQDVARDWEIGRIYLPLEDRERFDYTREDYEQRRINQPFLNLMEYEVRWARQYLVSGQALVPLVPGRLQITIDLFARGGLVILKGIERTGYRVWERRPTVSKWDVFVAALASVSGYVQRCIF